MSQKTFDHIDITQAIKKTILMKESLNITRYFKFIKKKKKILLVILPD